MNETIKSSIAAFKQQERNLVNAVGFAAFEMGRLLTVLEKEEADLKLIIDNDFDSSYSRCMAYKNFYQFVVKQNPDVRIILNGMGVDRTLAFVEPLKGQSGEFLLKLQDEIGGMSVRDIREEAQIFLGAKKHLKKSEEYFRLAENALFDVLGMFTGAVSGKYRDDFVVWDGRTRVLGSAHKLVRVLEGLR